LSMGSQVILCAIIGGVLARYLGFAGLVIGSVGTGLLLSLLMGTIYRVLKIPTMVVSLGMTYVFEVFGTILTKGIGYIDVTPEVAAMGNTPYNFVIGAIAAILFYLIYYKTKFGFHARALGTNDIVATNLGLNNNKIKAQTYMIGGAFYGIAAVLMICYAGSVTSKMSLSSLNTLFPPIIAVLIGLQLKSIVENFTVTILIGAFSVTILFTGLVAVGLPATIQDFLTGAFMIGVMVISTNRHRISHYFYKRKLNKQYLKRKSSVSS